MRKNILECNGFVDFSFVFGQSFLQPRNCIEIFLIVVALPTQFVAIISCALNFINKCIKEKVIAVIQLFIPVSEDESF